MTHLLTEARVLELARKHCTKFDMVSRITRSNDADLISFARALLAEHEAAKLVPTTWQDYEAGKAEFIAAHPDASQADIEAHAKQFARREGL